MITLSWSKEEAEALSNSLSDLLCWHRGFAAARGDSDSTNDPQGVHTLSDLNGYLKAAMRDAERKECQNG